MAIRKVAVLGNPVLRKVADPVPESDIDSPETKALIQDMLETMMEYDGIGLAAPQIHVSKRIVLMMASFDGEENELLVLINPKIKALTKETSAYWEGCLSVPGMRGLVARPNKIQLTAFNQNKEKIERVLEGFAATVVQHECDHLDGSLYVDKVVDKQYLAFEKEYQRYLSKADLEG